MSQLLMIFRLAALLFVWVPSILGWELASREDLTQALKSNDYSLVAFVAPSQEKSKSLEPEWESAASEGKESLLAIDCETAQEECNGHGVDSYPEAHLFKGQTKLAQYQGPKRAAAILHFAARRKRPVVSKLASADVTSFKTADETVFIAYLAPGDEEEEESTASKAFAALAERYKDEFSFGVVTDPAAAEAEQVKTTPSVVCYKLVDGDTVLFSDFGGDQGNQDEIEKKLEVWLRDAWRPVIAELTPWTRQRLLDRAWPMVYLFAPDEPSRLKLRHALYRFARSYYDSLTAALVDPLEYRDLMGQMGLEPGVFPAGAVHQLSKDRIYPYPSNHPFDSNALQKWGLDVWQGRIKPWVPEGAPTTTYDDLGPTKVATRKFELRSVPGMKIKVAGHDEL